MKKSLNTSTILARLRKKSPPRFAIVLLALLGFLLQSHVAQTHFHTACTQAAAAEACPPAAGDGARQSGGSENSSTCALCQIAAHGGAAPLQAMALSFAAPHIALFTPVAQVPAGAVAAISHSWQSRAPPIV